MARERSGRLEEDVSKAFAFALKPCGWSSGGRKCALLIDKVVVRSAVSLGIPAASGRACSYEMLA